MTPEKLRQLGRELEEFLDYITAGMGRAERREAMGNYVRGLLLDGERKSMQPLAARLVSDPDQAEATRQRLQQAVSVAAWDGWELFRRIAVRAKEVLCDIGAFVLDDTGFPKKGRSSVGVQRQYSGTMGRIDNCQVATSLHLASESGGVCIGMRLFLPQSWADSPNRRTKAGVPKEIVHQTKHDLALGMLDRALAWDIPRRPVVADAGYGDSTAFRDGLEERGLEYVLRVSGTAVVWPPGTCPTPPEPKPPGLRGRARTKWVAPEGVTPLPIAELGESLGSRRFRRVTWRDGTRGPQTRRFAVLRVRTAHRHGAGHTPGEEQWLLCEWSFREKKPTAFYLSNLPKTTTLKRLVYLAKLRWRIERDYQEMKSELGLDHFEGRTWQGFHHHVALVAAAHAFLTLHRALFSPDDWASRASTDVSRLSEPASSRAAPIDRALPHVRSQRKPARTADQGLMHVIK
jgi:SRSO17 transposase